MVGIYKIENKINNLVYIGQSINIHKRWKAHMNRPFNIKTKEYNIPLYKDIRKYGLDNFTFEVLEECEKDKLNERETYWVFYYNSFFNGYNESFGGVSHCKQSNISKDKIIGIINDLKTTNMKHNDIAQKWNISTEMVQGINTGRYWKHNTSYPIQPRDFNKGKNGNFNGINHETNKCSICGKEIGYKARYCVECAHILSRKVDRPTKEELLKLILTTSFIKIGEMFNVSDNAIRRWCKSYGLPYKYNDIKAYKESLELV